jgi:hypothetical protein
MATLCRASTTKIEFKKGPPPGGPFSFTGFTARRKEDRHMLIPTDHDAPQPYCNAPNSQSAKPPATLWDLFQGAAMVAGFLVSVHEISKW